MKAMVLSRTRPIEENPLELADVDVPEVRDNELLLSVHVCGICRTDLHTVEGDLELPKLPVIPGHQIVGEVAKLGPSASRFKVGDRVGAAWLHSTCGQCRYCRRGLENLCEDASFTGFDVDGGYAEHARVPEDFAYRIPEGFADISAAPLLCAGIIGYRALRLSETRPGGRLGLYGFGASAHVSIQVAMYWGCEVYVFTRSDRHRQLARELGASWTGTVQDDPPSRVDSAIIFAPAGELVPEALKVLAKGGTLALAGIHMTPIPQMDYEKHLYYEKTIRSVTASTRRDGEELLELAARIPIRTEVEMFPLEEANHALQLLKASGMRGAGVLEVAGR